MVSAQLSPNTKIKKGPTPRMTFVHEHWYLGDRNVFTHDLVYRRWGMSRGNSCPGWGKDIVTPLLIRELETAVSKGCESSSDLSHT